MRWSSTLLLAVAAICAFGQTAPSKQELKARAFLARNKPYKALTVCDHNLGKTVHPEFWSIRADALNRIGEYMAAQRDARAAMAAFPGSSEALFQLAIAEQGVGRFDSAEVHFMELLMKDRSGEVRYRTALNYQARHNYRDALLQLDQALVEGAKDKPDAAKFHRVKGECLAMRNDSILARQSFDEALRSAPDDPITLNSRGWFLFAHNGDHARAIRDYDRAIKLNPNYSYAFNNRGWSWYKLGQKEKGLKDIRIAQRKKVFNPFIYRNLGIIALESGDVQAACTNFRRALDYNFTALYGDEVFQLVEKNCARAAPEQAPNAPLDRPAQKPVIRSNAP